MQTFKTLMLREWMQHHFGWLLLGAIPLGLMMLMLSFGSVQVGDSHGLPPPEQVAVLFSGGYSFFVMVLIGIMLTFQAPGLARRDREDRSIEFWLSLPNSHGASVGATVLMNIWLLPLMAFGLAAAGAVVCALIAVARVHGLSGLAQMSWGTFGSLLLMGQARLALGMVLGTLWLSPFLLGAMALSAWLKRWGVALGAGVLTIGSQILAHVYHMPWLLEQLVQQFEHAGWAFLPTLQGNQDFDSDQGGPLGMMLADFGHWMAQDTALALGDLATPRFLVTLLLAAACFGLVVLRRARG
jgi:ABC-2 type transport system permease protein